MKTILSILSLCLQGDIGYPGEPGYASNQEPGAVGDPGVTGSRGQPGLKGIQGKKHCSYLILYQFVSWNFHHKLFFW